MAQAGQTGTPPATGAPAGAGGNEPVGGNDAGGNPNSSGGRRLIAGKYETMEDAVEQGIFGMEKAFHQTREDLAKVTRILEHAVGSRPPMDPRGGYAPVGTPGYGSGGYDYGRGQPNNDPDYVDPANFIVNPTQVLKAREQRMLNQVANVVENVVANAMVVAEFKRLNPDLVQHERVVRAMMNETDQSKPYDQRLADAAKMTRDYLVSVRAAGGGNANPAPGGSSYVEPPRGGGGPGGGLPLVPGQNAPSGVDEEEQELLDYIKERNNDMAARFGIKT